MRASEGKSSVADMLAEIGGFLQAQGLGTIGADLFFARLMDSDVPPFAVALFQGQGLAGMRTQDVSGVAYQQPRLDILVRGAPSQYGAAMAQAEAIHEALTGLQGGNLSGHRYLAVEALAPPYDSGRDGHNRPLIATHYLCWRTPAETEGVVFASTGFPAPMVTLGGVPVYFTAPGNLAPLRTSFGTPVYWSETGDGWNTPAHT